VERPALAARDRADIIAQVKTALDRVVFEGHGSRSLLCGAPGKWKTGGRDLDLTRCMH
jgi:hypothetical protein